MCVYFRHYFSNNNKTKYVVVFKVTKWLRSNGFGHLIYITFENGYLKTYYHGKKIKIIFTIGINFIIIWLSITKL